jgi:hypothetical protein
MRDRNHVITVGLAVSVVVACLTFITGWWLSERHVQYDKQADYYAAEHASRTPEELLGACGEKADLQLVECLSREIETQRERKRGEGDLAAQQQMAFSTLGMLLVSAVALAATTIGVIFVWLTLRETRRQGEMELRAYISIVDGFLDFSKRDQVHALVHLRNSGQTPAFMLTDALRMEIFDSDRIPNDLHRSMPAEEGGAVRPVGPNVEITLRGEYHIPGRTWEAVELRLKALVIWGKLEYDTFGIRRTTKFCLVATFAPTREEKWVLGALPFGNEAT